MMGCGGLATDSLQLDFSTPHPLLGHFQRLFLWELKLPTPCLLQTWSSAGLQLLPQLQLRVSAQFLAHGDAYFV